MSNFIIRRVFLGLFIVFFGAMIVYGVIRSLPSSYVETVARQRAANPTSLRTYQEWLDELNQVYHLDVGIIPGYFGWVKNAIRGDFGVSWIYNVPVTQKFKEVIPYSIFLNIITFAVQIIVSIPLGILAARKQYSGVDYAITVFALAGLSLPTFFLATLLKYVFSVKLGWFPLYGLTSDSIIRWIEQGSSWIWQKYDLANYYLNDAFHWWFDALYRTNMLEVLNSDYIRTARAKVFLRRWLSTNTLSETRHSIGKLHEHPVTCHVWWLHDH